MREVLRAVLPSALVVRIRALLAATRIYREAMRDARRYVEFSAPSDDLSATSDEPRHVECQLIKDCHRVEKGLAMVHPRKPFGSEVAERLDRDLSRLEGVVDEPFCGYARDARRALAEWNSGGARSDDLAPIIGDAPDGSEVGLEGMFLSRHSIRNFDSWIPDSRALERAVELALHTPSVCNRQAWRVHFYRGVSVRRILALHHGSGGFADTVPCVGVITVDSRLFAGVGERNQRWIDGGLFAMSLVWALHGLGLGTCMLNWSRGVHDSDRLRRVAEIGESWEIVALVAVGRPAVGARATRSPRRGPDEVAVFHQD